MFLRSLKEVRILFVYLFIYSVLHTINNFGFIFLNIIIISIFHKKNQISIFLLEEKKTMVREYHCWNLQWNLQQTYKPIKFMRQVGR